jgi:hypothetical protein
MPGHDQTIELQNLSLQRPQLGAESSDTRTGNVGQTFVACIGDNAEQLLNTFASDRCDNPKLGQMS